MKNKYNDLLNEAIQNSLNNGEETLKYNFKKAERYLEKNLKIIKSIKNTDFFEKFLKDVMEQGNVYAKNSAAIHALRNNLLKEKALNILKNDANLQEKEYRFIAFNSKVFLKDIYPNL